MSSQLNRAAHFEHNLCHISQRYAGIDSKTDFNQVSCKLCLKKMKSTERKFGITYITADAIIRSISLVSAEIANTSFGPTEKISRLAYQKSRKDYLEYERISLFDAIYDPDTIKFVELAHFRIWDEMNFSQCSFQKWQEYLARCQMDKKEVGPPLSKAMAQRSRDLIVNTLDQYKNNSTGELSNEEALNQELVKIASEVRA